MEGKGQTELVFQGIAASQGISYGQIFLFVQKELDIPQYQVEPSKRIEEISRFERALVDTRREITKVKAEVARKLSEEEALIFDAHLLVLEDQALISETIREFETTGTNIETCFHRVAMRYISAFERIDDEYLRERVADIRDVAKRVLNTLLGQVSGNLGELSDNRIVVSNDISPSDAASIDRSRALGIVTDGGSRTSHAVIVARSMKIPSVVGLRTITQNVRSGDWAIIDGYEGIVILHPSEQTLFRYGKLQQRRKSVESRIAALNKLPSETLDGTRIPLFTNLEKSDEAHLVREYNAEGVGLYRTEFLFLNSPDVPGEEEQFRAYNEVAEALAPLPIIIRTLDIGGDKTRPGATQLIEPEQNPFLGFRAIRFCLENPGIFKMQLRAILRASVHGNVRIMYPMISGADEVIRANKILDECKLELAAARIKFDENLEVGSMIEIPSAAATIDILANHSAFFSIGTNDLIQYLLAIDRVNNRIAHLYEPTHPAVLRTLKSIFDEARRHKISVSICGELAGDPVFAPLLIGLGAESLSMTPPLVPAVRYIVRSMTLAEAQKLAKDALALSDSKKIYALIEDFYKAHTTELTQN